MSAGQFDEPHKIRLACFGLAKKQIPRRNTSLYKTCTCDKRACHGLVPVMSLGCGVCSAPETAAMLIEYSEAIITKTVLNWKNHRFL